MHSQLGRLLATPLALVAGLICLNGRLDGPLTCICRQGFHGEHCERTSHCLGFDRHENNSCFQCQAGWKGNLCDLIDCGEHGSSSEDDQQCNCVLPYTGLYCSRLNSSDVYHHYNHAMINTLGPAGVLIIVPLIALLVGCNALQKKRSDQRLTTLLEQNNTLADR